MATQRSTDGASNGFTAVAFPMDEATWNAVAKRLALSRQQTRVVEQILCGQKDKEIAATLGVTIPTIRAHLGRVFNRMEVDDRMLLVLRIFTMTLEFVRSENARQK